MDTMIETNAERYCVPLAVRSEDDSGQLEFGVSFAGPNPPEKDYVPVKDAETATKLVYLIQLYFPQSRFMNQAGDHLTNSAGSN